MKAATRWAGAMALVLALGLAAGGCADGGPDVAGPGIDDGAEVVEGALVGELTPELIKLLKVCGGPDGLTCGKGKYCRTRSCSDDSWGRCMKKPVRCPHVVKPVCGCDGKTYRNACMLARAGVSKASNGACPKPDFCGGIAGFPCPKGEVCIFEPGTCDVADNAGKCVEPPKVCPLYYKPVCGCDGKTYGNPCEATAAGVSIDHAGPCCEPVTCDLYCEYGFMTDENGCEICQCNPPPPCCDPAKKPDCTFEAACCASGDWMCTSPTGPICEPGKVCPVLDLCAGFEPPGCVQTGCPDGQLCDQSVGCVSSYCSCDPATGDILCTDDCGGGTCVPEEPAPCGGIAGFQCPSDEQVCIYPPGTCDIVDNLGECVYPPDACIALYDPVCGCDGKTYGNACEATAAGASVDHEGPCCKPVLCEIFCQYGFATDENGCEICKCNPPPACCDPAEEPGVGGNPFCFEGASCCATGKWQCNQADGSSTCEAPGKVCPVVDKCEGFEAPGCVQSGCPSGYVCDPTVGCNPSACKCDPLTGEIVCTDDCGGGTCVPEGPAPCGGIAGFVCPDKGQVCIYAPGTCDIVDNMGTCVTPPDACIQLYDPVCGCDGKTHGNACMATMAGVSVDHEGECKAPPSCCDPAQKPVCAFEAACCANGDWMCTSPSGPICESGKICPVVDKCEGFEAPGCVQSGCPSGYVCDPTVGCNPSACKCDPLTGEIVCTDDCGGGTCVPEGPAPCGGIAGFVCPDKGQVCIYAPGTCDIVDNMGTCVTPPDACIQLYDPVCGCDGKTYGNACMATMAGVSVDHEGECKAPGDLCEDFVAPGCSQSGCPEGYVCDKTVGCNPSICSCDPSNGYVICTADCGGGTCVKAEPTCCDPKLEPGTSGLPFCFEGASCCADGSWACNMGDGSPACKPGKVCPVAIEPVK